MQGAPTNLQLSLRLMTSMQLACFSVMPCLAQPTPAAAQPTTSAAQPVQSLTQSTPAKATQPTGTATNPAAPVQAEILSDAQVTAPDAAEKPAKVLLSPGQALSVDAGFEDIVCTNDVNLARKQRESFPDSAEASFIYAVALSRTCAVEDALKEVRRARRLAEKEGGPSYFDKMIESYEKMLSYYPDDNQVRYHLAWAYYMKAYVLAKYSQPKQGSPAYQEWVKAAANPQAKHDESEEDKAGTSSQSKTAVLNDMGHIRRTVESASPQAIPQIQTYYKMAMDKLDQVLAANPTDIWARIYRAHLAYEAGGPMDASLKEWLKARDQNPDNPAPYFFLGEGFLKQGNLKECLLNVSKAVALRSDKTKGGQ